MRTYARKRTEYQLIEGVHEMCRLCLEKVKETVPIFTDTENVCPSLTMRIMMCVGLEITREDCLPDMICTECHKELNNYYEFKKRCILTYQKLKSHVLAVKQTGTKHVPDLKVKQNENETLNVLDRVSNDNVEPVLAVNETQELEVNIGPNDLSNVPTENIEKPSAEPTANVVVTPGNQDVSEFISSILSELGILTRNGDQVLMVDQNVKLIEIETGDDTKVILELVEVDEGQQNATKNNISNNEISIQSTIKYIEPCDIEHNVIQPKDERARCPQCGKHFASRGALRRHARVHSGERPYACAACGRAFAQREVLRRHELVHGGTAGAPPATASLRRSLSGRAYREAVQVRAVREGLHAAQRAGGAHALARGARRARAGAAPLRALPQGVPARLRAQPARDAAQRARVRVRRVRAALQRQELAAATPARQARAAARSRRARVGASVLSSSKLMYSMRAVVVVTRFDIFNDFLPTIRYFSLWPLEMSCVLSETAKM